MNSATLQQISNIKQDAQDGKFTMQGLAFTNLLHSLIRDHGRYYDGSYSVDVDAFAISDKRLILSYIESAEWYEYACKSIATTESLFSECKDHVQHLIDEDCYEVYKQDMEEMREAI
jgi:hypothetical protein